MGFFSSSDDRTKEEKAVDVLQYKAYKKALDANSERAKRAREHDEDPTYYLFNRAVLDSEKNVPWWRR